ncbi:hypothetical protein [Metabacillus fastidiosus]|uniref:hypothetical protein n=1 Tax=Metabacillus fastidiosus TaxID=1458 RepID=UPI0012E7129C|nr:hypothetical protein [Metabacillus fastidiosus]
MRKIGQFSILELILLKVLIGMTNVDLAQAFSKHINEKGNQVLDVCVSIEDLLQFLMNDENGNLPDIILMSTDVASKLSDKRLEFLADCIVTIRDRFPKIKFIILANEKAGHPFLAELVSIGIYNIFLTSSKKISLDELLETAENPLTFSEIKFLRVVNKEIPWRRGSLQSQPNEVQINITKKYENGDQLREEPNRKPILSPKVGEFREASLLNHIDEEDFLQEYLPTKEKEKVVIQDKIIGAVFVGIVGVEKNTGSTHLSLLLANFLNNRGLRVAVIEANNSNDFFSVEYVYEGGRGYTSKKEMFNIDGIDHYKSIGKLNFSELVHQYDFIILDIGQKENTQYFEEFFRAHIKIVTSHASEWKRDKLMDFLLSYQEYDQQNWHLVLPFADSQTLEDIEKETLLFPYSIPTHSDPYQRSEELNMVFEDMLQENLPTLQGAAKQSAVWLYGGLSILVLVFIVIAITFFK